MVDEDGVRVYHHSECQEVGTAERALAQPKQIITAALDQVGYSKVIQGVPLRSFES